MEIEELSNKIEVYQENEEGLDNFINDFQIYSNLFQLTNVAQLEVEKAKCHLDRLHESILQKWKDHENNVQPEVDSGSYDSIPKTKFINIEDCLKIKDILLDTCSLLSKLEFDKEYVENEILKQKAKVAELIEKINSLARFRLETIPEVVQKEHEACSNDISELQWHIKHRAGIEKRLKLKRDRAADINSEMRETMEDITERIPLVKEKLNMEEAVLNKIHDVRKNLYQDASSSKERLKDTEDKESEANNKAEAERNHIKRDLHQTNKTLLKTERALQHAEKEHEKLLDFKAKNEEKIRINHENIANSNKEIEAKRRNIDNLDIETDRNRTQLKELQFDNKRLNGTCNERTKEHKQLEETQREARQRLIEEKDQAYQNLTELNRLNTETKLEMDSMKNDIQVCDQETEKLKEKILKTKQNITSAKKDFEQSVAEFTAVSRKHGDATRMLEDDTRQKADSEEKLKKNLADIESMIKQEILTKTTVQARIENDSGELDNLSKEVLGKEKQLKKMLREIEKSVKVAKQKEAETELEHGKSCEEKLKLETKYNEAVSEQDQIRQTLQSKIDELSPVHEDLKNRLNTLTQKEEHIDWQVKTMNTQLAEISDSAEMIKKARKKLKLELLKLERDHNELAIELEAVRRTDERISDSVLKMNSREERQRSEHYSYLNKRSDLLDKMNNEIKELLAKNEQLATNYRTMQTDFYGMQDDYLNLVQDQIWTEEKIKNSKEIQRLQKHMHNCLDAFFSMKLLYDFEEFHELQDQSSQNQAEVKRLGDKYQQASDIIKEFLKTRTSDPAT